MENIKPFWLEEDTIIQGMGFILIFIGILLVFLNESLLNFLCSDCSVAALENPFLLMIFSGILFVVSGSVLVFFYTMYI
ncbi:MAG: hypothetical protein WC867_07495 [Candidatus Pacearchaeota archaeon]|jgi:uncharacterized membrane protein